MIKWVYKLCQGIMRIFYTIWYRIEFIGVENIPKHEGYIVACNHFHVFDPIFVSLKIKQPIHFLGKAELFDNPYYGWIFKVIGGIRVDRGAGSSTFLDSCKEISEIKESIGIFPEGTRGHDGKLGRPKSGMSLIAKLTGYDVLPCSIRADRSLKFGSKVVIIYGELIKAEELGLVDESPRSLKISTKYVWGKISELYGTEETNEQ